jgi:hypothetical protein
MAKNKKRTGDDEDLKPIDIPEEEDKVLPVPTEDEELLTDELDEEDEEEPEDGDVF